ncbi:sulfurtransferase complex subunit TusB [Vibrio sp.]|nr:sulfurtransferase complex subunit TusB [Vibrio sp.]
MLHILKSQSIASTALKYVSEEDCILLIEDAVYLANDKHQQHALINRFNVYCLKEDADARAIKSFISSEISLIGYRQFARLTAEHEQSLTWD